MKLPVVLSTTAKDNYGLLFTKSLPEEIGIKSSAEASITPVTSDVTRRAKKARQRAAKYGPKKLLLAKTTPEKQVMKGVEPAIMVIHEQNMKKPKKEPDNLAAQVTTTSSQLDQFLTDDDNTIHGRAFDPDPIGLMPDGTEASNMPEAIARTVDKPKSVEHYANSADASMTSYEAGKLAGTRIDPPELDREVTKKEYVTKTAVIQPKDDFDPESIFRSTGPSRRFVEPPDKLPMPTAASNRKVQCIQPIGTRAGRVRQVLRVHRQ